MVTALPVVASLSQTACAPRAYLYIAAISGNVRSCRIAVVTSAVTPAAGHGGVQGESRITPQIRTRAPRAWIRTWLPWLTWQTSGNPGFGD
jgi:hypothetical protein